MQIPVPHPTSTKSKYPEMNTGNPGTLLKYACLKFAKQWEVFIIKHIILILIPTFIGKLLFSLGNLQPQVFSSQSHPFQLWTSFFPPIKQV